MSNDLDIWREQRPDLVRLAYRMLGDLSHAEDVVQEAWLRWSGRGVAVDAPRAYLVSIVTRLCLSELGSARARLEESRSNRLPEPVSLVDAGLAGDGAERLAVMERISMAFLVLLQRLSPAERAVLVLHDVFELDHREIGALLGKSEPGCRKLLERARASVASERRMLEAPREEHTRLLEAFVRAASQGDIGVLVGLLADDAVMITDGGARGSRIAGIRNLATPLSGAARIAAFVAATTNVTASQLESQIQELNGQPALVLLREGQPFAAVLLGVANGKIERVFFQADPLRLRHLASQPLG